MEMCGELEKIPQSEELIRSIEDIDFAKAMELIATLRKSL